MRHFVLGLCVLTVAAPVTDAFAQNYLPTRDYSGPGTIVNMDVLQSGGAYHDYGARPPILSMPLPAPVAAPAPAPDYQPPHMPSLASPHSVPVPLPSAAPVPAIAAAPVPLLPPVPMPQAISGLPGSGKTAPVQQAVSPSAPPQHASSGVDAMVAVMDELPPVMPAPVVAETTPPSRHYSGGAPFADELSRKLPEAVPLITEKTPDAMPSPVASAPMAPVVLPSQAQQQPVPVADRAADIVPPVAVAAQADRLLTPTITSMDGVFPTPIAGGRMAAAPVNAQPLITERAATAPVSSVTPVQKPTSDQIMWDMPALASAPVTAGMPVSHDLTVPPIAAIATGTTGVDVAPVAGLSVPRVPASELRQAQLAALPERQVLASINDDLSPALPDPVMGRKAVTYSELGVPGAMPAPSFDAPRNAVDNLVVPPMPLSGQHVQDITGLSDVTFPQARPIEAPVARNVVDGQKTAMLAPPAAPLSGAKPSQARQINTEDDFEAYRIFFDASSDQLKPGEMAVLNKIVGKMQGDPAIRLRMQAYAAGTPDTAGQARRLSLSRAMKIRSYMTEKGIPATRLDVRALGMGSAELGDTIKKNNAPADRVDVIFIRS